MKLVADSGSTKTHWMLMGEEGERHCVTVGLNPLFADREVFDSACRQVVSDLGIGEKVIRQLFFYGAGCGTESSCQRVRQWLQDALECEEIEVGSDLLGACRATCGREPGMVGIMGTGSNMCYYDGREIARRRVSTGYILGDEGSGNHIGKRLLKDYLEERMPQGLRAMFHADYPMEAAAFIDRLYRQPNPNRFLASLAAFASRHKEDVYVQRVLSHCFEEFFEQTAFFGEHALLPLHLVGGLVTSFEPEMHRAASVKGVTLGTLTPSPVGGLARYHGL